MRTSVEFMRKPQLTNRSLPERRRGLEGGRLGMKLPWPSLRERLLECVSSFLLGKRLGKGRAVSQNRVMAGCGRRYRNSFRRACIILSPHRQLRVSDASRFYSPRRPRLCWWWAQRDAVHRFVCLSRSAPPPPPAIADGAECFFVCLPGIRVAFQLF